MRFDSSVHFFLCLSIQFVCCTLPFIYPFRLFIHFVCSIGIIVWFDYFILFCLLWRTTLVYFRYNEFFFGCTAMIHTKLTIPFGMGSFRGFLFFKFRFICSSSISILFLIWHVAVLVLVHGLCGALDMMLWRGSRARSRLNLLLLTRTHFSG